MKTREEGGGGGGGVECGVGGRGELPSTHRSAGNHSFRLAGSAVCLPRVSKLSPGPGTACPLTHCPLVQVLLVLSHTVPWSSLTHCPLVFSHTLSLGLLSQTVPLVQALLVLSQTSNGCFLVLTGFSLDVGDSTTMSARVVIYLPSQSLQATVILFYFI